MKHKHKPQIPIETSQPKWMEDESDSKTRAPFLGTKENLDRAERLLIKARRSKRWAIALILISLALLVAHILLTFWRH